MVKDIKLEWKCKVGVNKSQSYSKLEKNGLEKESFRYKLLEDLKQLSPPGPFTSVKDVETFYRSDISVKDKYDHFQKEIRYMKLYHKWWFGMAGTRTRNGGLGWRENVPEMVG